MLTSCTCTHGRREDDKNHLFQDPAPPRRAAPRRVFFPSAARRVTSGRRDLSRNECPLDRFAGCIGSKAENVGKIRCRPLPRPTAAEAEAAIGATPPRRPPGAMAQRESRVKRGHRSHTTRRKRTKKIPPFLLCVSSDPIRRTDLTSNRAHATMRGREGAFSQTKAARRRAAVSVDLTPERTEPRVSTSPRPPTCVRIVAGAVPTPTVPWQNPVWWSAWLPPRVRMQTVVSLIQQWLCLTRKDLPKW